MSDYDRELERLAAAWLEDHPEASVDSFGMVLEEEYARYDGVAGDNTGAINDAVMERLGLPVRVYFGLYRLYLLYLDAGVPP